MKLVSQEKLLNSLLPLFISLIAVSLAAFPLLAHADANGWAGSGFAERGLFHDCLGDICDCESGPSSSIAGNPIPDPIFAVSLFFIGPDNYSLPLASPDVFRPPSAT